MPFIDHTPAIKTRITYSSRRAVEYGANLWRNEILKNLSGDRSGRTYYVPGTHKEYQASSPGESPASATGNLRTSIGMEVISDTEAQVGSSSKYAWALEKGRKDGHFSPRPYFVKAYEENEKKIQYGMRQIFQQER